jgi:hypothetical protein
MNLQDCNSYTMSAQQASIIAQASGRSADLLRAMQAHNTAAQAWGMQGAAYARMVSNHQSTAAAHAASAATLAAAGK